MQKRTVQVTVHREPSGYWAELPEFNGCFATGGTLDELLVSVYNSLSLYLGDHEPDRITSLQLEIESDLKPADAEDTTRRPPHRTRRSHRDDDWPPRPDKA